MTWAYYLIACWPLIGLIMVAALCRVIHKSKVRDAGREGSFEA